MTVDKALRYVTFLYLNDINSASANFEPYTEYANWKKWFKYDIQDAKLLPVCELLSDFVKAALGTISPNPPSRPVVDLEEERQVAKSRPHP